MSGSPARPARICALLKERTRFQLVRGSETLFLDFLPVGPPFVRLRSPRRYDVPFFIAPIRIDDGNLYVVYQPDRVDACLAVVEPIINLLQRGTIEDLRRIRESYSMALYIDTILPGIPREAHLDIYEMYLQLSRMPHPIRRWGMFLSPQLLCLAGDHDLGRINGIQSNCISITLPFLSIR